MKYIVTVFFFLILMSYPLSADIYSWVDENGVRHFTNNEPVENSEAVEVNDEIEHEKVPEKKNENRQVMRQRMRRKMASYEREEQEKKAKKLVAEQEKKLISAHNSLKKLKELTRGTVVWSEYRTLLGDARASIGSVKSVTGQTQKTSMLTEICAIYGMALQLRTLYIAKRNPSLIKLLKKMNGSWLTNARTYHQGRKVCWERAVDKLNSYNALIK